MVKYHCKLSDGSSITGRTDGDWLKTKEYLLESKKQIVALSISNAHGGGNIDPNCDGYFIGNKSIATMPSGISVDLVGIGYWRKHDNTVRIKWYNAQTMELMHTEARTPEEAGLSLIRNP
jgi:hypothetical protein